MYGFNLTPSGNGWYEIRFVCLDDANIMYTKEYFGNIRLKKEEYEEFEKENFISFESIHRWNQKRKAELKILNIISAYGYRSNFEVIWLGGNIETGLSFECTDLGKDSAIFKNNVNNIIDELAEKYPFYFSGRNNFNIEIRQDHSDGKAIYTIIIKDFR